MRIGLITTLSTNIGDDLIRRGICILLQEIFKTQKIEFISINKHYPLTVYPGWHPIHFSKIVHRLPRVGAQTFSLIENVTSKLGLSFFDSCDLIIQCGAPVLWPGCHKCEWAEPLWHHVIGRLHQRIPVINIAAGSCYPWENQPDDITDTKDREFLQKILGYCKLTTARDMLAQRLCTHLGTKTPFLPCTAFLSAGLQTNNIQSDNEGVVLINYMDGGGHFEWNQKIDPSIWEKTIKTLINRLKPRHKLAFLCHNESEYIVSQNLDPTIFCFWPKTPDEYFNTVLNAKAAICNRMHASIALASLGIPSVAVCTDTRLMMVDAIGLPNFFVSDVTVDLLEDQIENLLNHRHQEQMRLLTLRSEIWSNYISLISNTLY